MLLLFVKPENQCNQTDACHGHGTCTPTDAGAVTCTCEENYDGDTCDRHTCPDMMTVCQNGGTCKYVITSCMFMSPDVFLVRFFSTGFEFVHLARHLFYFGSQRRERVHVHLPVQRRRLSNCRRMRLRRLLQWHLFQRRHE